MTSLYPRALALTLVLAGLGLSGCGGSINFPDAVSAQQHQGPPVHGSVYGGHAPIVGSHVYMLQPGTTGYGSPATSLLQPGSGGVTANANDPNVPVGAGYVTTDSTGSFFISSYTCTVGQPVFLYSYGGATPANQPPTTSKQGYGTATYSISQFVVSNATTGTTGTATYTATVTTPSNFTAGESVTLANSYPVNGAQTVLKSGLTPTQFSFVASNYVGPNNGTAGPGSANLGDGTYASSGATVTGYGTSPTATSPTTNPIVQLATLGLCPSSGNFNGVLSFVFMNEVSTVATAYTFQPFTLASNNSAWDIGTSGTTQALLGISNAALTAAQLYSIQGNSNLVSTTNDGEGHIANYQTQSSTFVFGKGDTYTPNAGTGIVPQATIDTLANILAACIDSTPGTGGVLSSQCSTLFNTATDNGGTVNSGDTPAIDTATAAINIARYPAGNHSATADPNYVTNLYGIPTGTVPYAPYLNQAPHDWTIAINYPYAAEPGYSKAVNPHFQLAESLEIDNSGEVWVTSQNGAAVSQTNTPAGPNISRMSFLGINNVTDTFGYIPGYVSLDGSGNAWTGNANSTSPIYEAGSNGVFTAQYGSGYNKAYVVLADQAGDIFTFANTASTGSNYEMFEYPAGSTTSTKSTQINISPSIISAGKNIGHGAIDSAGDLWITSETSNQIARITPTGTSLFTPIVTPQQPEFPAIDASGNAWIAIQETNSEIYVVSPTGGQTVLTSGTTGAELTSTFGAAIDGNGNAWFVNRAGNYGQQTNGPGTNSLIEINGTTQTAISPPTNYVPEAQYGTNAGNTTLTPILYGSLNLAIDPSGNIWITNYTGNEVVEVVGAAAPVVTPLSVAAGTGKLGQKP